MSISYGMEEAIKQVGQEGSCLKEVEREISVMVHPKYTFDQVSGVRKELDGLARHFNKELEGVVVAYDRLQLVSPRGWIFDTNPYIHLRVSARFIVFCPAPGDTLTAVVRQKSSGHLGCLAHGSFNVSVTRSPSEAFDGWGGSLAFEGDTLTLTVLFTSLTNSHMPYITATLHPDCIKELKERAEKEEAEAPTTSGEGKRILFDDDSGISSNEAEENERPHKRKRVENDDDDDDDEETKDDEEKIESVRKKKRRKDCEENSLKVDKTEYSENKLKEETVENGRKKKKRKEGKEMEEEIVTIERMMQGEHCKKEEDACEENERKNKKKKWKEKVKEENVADEKTVKEEYGKEEEEECEGYERKKKKKRKGMEVVSDEQSVIEEHDWEVNQKKKKNKESDRTEGRGRKRKREEEVVVKANIVVKEDEDKQNETKKKKKKKDNNINDLESEIEKWDVGSPPKKKKKKRQEESRGEEKKEREEEGTAIKQLGREEVRDFREDKYYIGVKRELFSSDEGKESRKKKKKKEEEEFNEVEIKKEELDYF